MLRIGSYHLQTPLVLAPMAGITDRPFRALCRRFGAGLTVSEMVSSNSLLWGSTKTRRRADHTGEPSPRSVQLVGADPVLMATAACYNVDQGADIIDINMGCPAKKVCNVMAGSALLKDERRVAEILTAVVKAVPVPVTLKMRTGWDTEHRNGPTIARIAEECGIQALAVHGRTRACGYSGKAEYDTIRIMKSVVSIPVIANGDITTPLQAREVLTYTAADGIMIGRAAQGRPWFFQQVQHFLSTGESLSDPEPTFVRDILLEHLEHIYAFYGTTTGLLVARKHLSWYVRGTPGASAYRAAVNQTHTTEQQVALTRDYFHHLLNDTKEIQ